MKSLGQWGSRYRFLRDQSLLSPTTFTLYIFKCIQFLLSANMCMFSWVSWHIRAILDSEFVISTSLHGLVLADAYGIPARMLRITENEPLFKYQDYYEGTGRSTFTFATSVEEALTMGGLCLYVCFDPF